ncbi:hypothetical protein DSL92_07620 [Billgrantia gudaonensis]|uniref:Uncharacterized protein n=1 Tax=Billgrantia gudaonensis TaxID=376427 RepID=A0A3S0VSG6_9GAMM|nr:hypothetical protein DSL92_07620 [Halomonas gudaonensis]
MAELCFGATIPVSVVAEAFLRFDPENYDHYIVLYQRLPRVLIALHAGALMACGLVLQGLTGIRWLHPQRWASMPGRCSSFLAGAYFLNLGIDGRGAAAVLRISGYLPCRRGTARGSGTGPERVGIDLVGALTSMLPSASPMPYC